MSVIPWGFPGGAVVKHPPANVEDAREVGSVPGLGRSPGVRNGTHSSILAGKFQGQRGLVDYSPWGYKESDTTEQRSTHIPY